MCRSHRSEPCPLNSKAVAATDSRTCAQPQHCSSHQPLLSDISGQVNSYEQIRLDNIKRNGAKIAAAKLEQAVDSLASSKQKQQPPRKKRAIRAAVPSARTLRSADATSQPATMPPKNAAPNSPSASSSNAGTPPPPSPATPKAESWTPFLVRAGLTPGRAGVTKRNLREISVSPEQLKSGRMTTEALVTYGRVS